MKQSTSTIGVDKLFESPKASIQCNDNHINLPFNSNCIVATFSKVKIRSNKSNPILSCISSTFQFNDDNADLKPKTESTLSYMAALNISELNVYIIHYTHNFWKDSGFYDKHYTYPNVLNLLFMSLDDFAKALAHDTFNDITHNSVFIFYETYWSDVIIKCKLIHTDTKLGVSISGGSSNKRHIVTTIQSRLIIYVMCLFHLDYNLLLNVNGFDTVTKNKYLPFADFTNNKMNICNKQHKATNIHYKLFLKDSLFKERERSKENRVKDKDKDNNDDNNNNPKSKPIANISSNLKFNGNQKR